MLGFTVRIWKQSEFDGPLLAWWTADTLRWIDDLVDQDRATLVEGNGGYPFRYDISAHELAPILLTSDREALARRLDVKRWPGDPHAHVDQAELRACDENAVLRVEAWDES